MALSKTKENLDSLKEEVPSIETVCADVGNWDETKAAVDSVLPIDLLVNNAAIAECIPFLEVPPDSFDRFGFLLSIFAAKCDAANSL